MQGKAIVLNLGREGLVQNSNVPDWSFLYRVSSVKDEKWNIGDKVRTPDGRTFRYCKSGGICYTGQGNKFYNAIPATGIDYSLLYAAAPVGSLSVQMTNQGTVAQTKDGLRGGMIILKPATDSGNDVLQMRGIIGNTAGGVSDVITIYLDGELTTALTTASYAFCMPSPYSDIRYYGSTGTSTAGIAAAYVSAAGKYFWLQTWGLCWITDYAATLGKVASQRQVVFGTEGSLAPHDYSNATHAQQQHAGFIVDNNDAANGATIIMLQIDP